MKWIFPATCFVIIILSITACNLQKEVEIELPEYDSQLVVEAYLEPGQPFVALITRSAAYFESFPVDDSQFLENILEDGATVSITHQGTTHELRDQLFFNPFTGKLFNYVSTTTVPEDFDNDFELKIVTANGQTVTSTTRILPIVELDSLVVQFSETNDTLARMLTYFTDNPDEDNFYRRMLHKGTLDSLQQDFTTDDQFVDNNIVVFGTNFDYEIGDTVISTLYHIDESYTDFLETLEAAFQANGNPFAQPSTIISNLQGDAIGIFTGLSVDRKQVVIQK